MITRTPALALILPATAAVARTTPGDRFLQNGGLDGNGTATPDEIVEMRGNLVVSFVGGARSRFERLDTNADGGITPSDFSR